MIDFKPYAEKIYKDAGDKDLIGVKLYFKPSEQTADDMEVSPSVASLDPPIAIAYYDPEFKYPVLKEELKSIFFVGAYVAIPRGNVSFGVVMLDKLYADDRMTALAFTLSAGVILLTTIDSVIETEDFE